MSEMKRSAPPVPRERLRDPIVTVTITGPHIIGYGVANLRVDDVVTFGCACGCHGRPIDLAMAPEPCPTIVGRVSVRDRHWMLCNLGSVRLLVENAECSEEYIGIGPGHLYVPMPFEITRIRSSCGGAQEITVLGFEPSLSGVECPCALGHGHTHTVHALDRRAAYFAVLQALCEPRLTFGPAAALPSSSQVAVSLRRRGIDLTARAVDAHIDYMLDKLKLRTSVGHTDGRRGWKREVLVTEALRRGLVTEP